MDEFNNIRDQKVFEILAIIKVIYMLLGMVAMISSYTNRANLKYTLFLI